MGQNSQERLTWIDEVEFDVPVYGKGRRLVRRVRYLFWVGCAGAYEDRAKKKTTKAVARAAVGRRVKFLVLGDGGTARVTCPPFRQRTAVPATGLPERRIPQRPVRGVERVDRKIVVTCPHCFNTLGREYPQVGGNYTVLHHTQLLNRPVRDKKLIPVQSASGDASPVTYHDPCYLGGTTRCTTRHAS